MHSGPGYSRKVTKTMKTKKIRLAVSMNEDGSKWSAQGWAGGEDDEMLNSCDECLTTAPRVRRFIEVEVPLPVEQPVLQGHLVAEEGDFQEGDLVRHMHSTLSWGTVYEVGDYIKVSYSGPILSSCKSSYKPNEIARKPIEVGDTVRVKGLGRGKVAGREATTMHPPRWRVWLDCEKPSTYMCSPEDCIAVAP